ELWIVAVPAPSSTAADLVVLARESLDTQVRTSLTVLGVSFVGVGRQAHVLIGTRAVAGPRHPAILEVVSNHAAPSRGLRPTAAFRHLVGGHQRVRGDN